MLVINVKNIVVKDKIINITGISDDDYISLTDLAKLKNRQFPADVIKNWLRLRSTIDFLGLWEQLNNKNFNMVEFDQFKKRVWSQLLCNNSAKMDKYT